MRLASAGVAEMLARRTTLSIRQRSSLVIHLQAARFAITAGSMLGSAVWSESVSHFSREKPAGGASSVVVIALGVQQLGPGTVQE